MKGRKSASLKRREGVMVEVLELEVVAINPSCIFIPCALQARSDSIKMVISLPLTIFEIEMNLLVR